MALFQKLKTLPLFLNYFLQSVDEHSLQAPFAFEMYSKLKTAKKGQKTDPDIEAARIKYLNNHEVISDQDLGAGSQIESKSSSRKLSTIARYGISSQEDCTFLKGLINCCPSSVCIELGTSIGIATAYLARSGHFEHVYSFEGNEVLVKHASTLLSSLDCDNWEIIEGNIDYKLPKLLQSTENIGFALIDANHTSTALLRYFDLLAEKMASNGIMLIDDIRWRMDMYSGWKELISRKKITLSLEYAQKGIVFFKQGIPKQHYVVSG